MNTMTKHFYATSTMVAALLAGCAATVPQELADARAAYQRTSEGPAGRLTPAEVHKAHEALQKAEVSFKADPESYRTRDLAYVALRQAETADELADIAGQSASIAQSDAEFTATQTLIVKQTKQDLTQSRADLAESERDTQKTAERLIAEKKAHSATGNRAAAVTAELATEQKARAAADKRAADALLALANLAAVKEDERGMVITLSGSVLFASDQSILLPSAQSRLGQVAEALMAANERTIIVEGHTDSRGKDGHNNELSLRRAEAVRNFLVQKGYDPSRITAQGVGKGRPVADNATAEGRANNRRVEIVVAPLARK